MELNHSDQIKAQLIESNDEFRQIYTEHHQLDEKLSDFASRHYLSEEDQIEEVRLKKLKLHLKTKLQEIIDAHRLQQVS